MASKLMQKSKALAPIDLNDFGNVTFRRLVQKYKAESPMLSIPSGITTVTRNTQ